MGAVKIDNRVITLSSLDKVWFPRSKISKEDVLKYYYQIADYMVPHIKDHLIALHRFPDGISGESFYQKNAGAYFPSWIKKIAVEKEEGGKVHYVLANNMATLLYLANQGTLAFHAWLSRYDKLYVPDRMIFDLDPSKEDFASVRRAAFLIRDILQDLKLPCFTMTTGSRGMHIYVPLKRIHTFDYVADFSYAIAHKMIQEDSKRYTLEIRKAKRVGKIFIDTLRNRYSATSVAPYSVRAKEKAPVAAPLFWDEVNSSQLTAQKFTIKTIMRKLSVEGDPWADITSHAVSLKKAYKQLIGDQ